MKIGKRKNHKMKKKFNLSQWQRNAALAPQEEVEIITSRIETAGMDIAPAYQEWRDLGFALAQGLGEAGRSYYHRLSRFYSGYKHAEADKQYTACLRSRGHGITLNTFFHLARRAGVDIGTLTLTDCQIDTLPPPPAVVHTPADAPAAPPPGPAAPPVAPAATPAATPPDAGEPPVFPDEVYTSLPGLLTDVCSYGISPEDTDMLLLGSLTVLSSCLTQVSGIYGQREVFPNLFLFISAQASAGKGRLTLCRHLVDVVHADLRQRNRREWEDYRREKALYEKSKRKEGGEEPQQPPVRMLFIPANSSSTALFQTLNDNEGQALMFETEGDTLANTFRSEHGNYSDGLRKAFHHETITYNRRKDREYVEISAPRLSVMLSGTPGQIGTLIPDAENGLFSRFLFYCLPLRPVWNDVFAGSGDDTLDGQFIRLGGRFFQFYRRLQQAPPLRFSLTAGQQTEFNRFFASLQAQGMECFGADLLASVRRLGLTAYRMCMTLSALRLMDDAGETALPVTLCCRDEDFRTVMQMMPVLLRHTGLTYQTLQPGARPDATSPATLGSSPREHLLQGFLQSLPGVFGRSVYLEKAVLLKIAPRSADRYIIELCNRGLLLKQGYDDYSKCE